MRMKLNKYVSSWKHRGSVGGLTVAGGCHCVWWQTRRLLPPLWILLPAEDAHQERQVQSSSSLGFYYKRLWEMLLFRSWIWSRPTISYGWQKILFLLCQFLPSSGGGNSSGCLLASVIQWAVFRGSQIVYFLGCSVSLSILMMCSFSLYQRRSTSRTCEQFYIVCRRPVSPSICLCPPLARFAADVRHFGVL